jgi:hypothetical protein
MFCIGRTIASILSQPETCPTDTAMHRLVSDWLQTLGKEEKDAFLTKAEFVEVLTAMVNQIPSKTKTLKEIYVTYFRSSTSPVAGPEDDEMSISSTSISPPVAPQPSIEPSSHSVLTPDPRVDDESNSVLSLLDGGDDPATRDKDDEISVNSTRSVKSNAGNEPKANRPVAPNTSSRPTSASSLRDKPLAVLPPINPNPDQAVNVSPRVAPSQSLSSRKPSIESQEKVETAPDVAAVESVATSFVTNILHDASVVAYCQETAQARKQFLSQSDPGLCATLFLISVSLLPPVENEVGFIEISQISLSRLASPGTLLDS